MLSYAFPKTHKHLPHVLAILILLLRNKLLYNFIFVNLSFRGNITGKYLKDFGAHNWREIVQDQDKWSDLVIAAKTLRELLRPEEEEDIYTDFCEYKFSNWFKPKPCTAPNSCGVHGTRHPYHGYLLFRLQCPEVGDNDVRPFSDNHVADRIKYLLRSSRCVNIEDLKNCNR
ncbi:Hypothetical protein CINCED_3A013024 [Cinara cedri]|uniref:Uncharacterized protein n=1 Tax=Cinara cedri TaxID=506608 RepID=A0A5E4NNJ3_9HEMI|nr:Hypothetical protein CINCED_3A013024 [Cinara cedri]